MRGIALGVVFFSLLPFVFGRGKIFGSFPTGPFLGILMWYWISLMNPQFLVWGGFFGRIQYALIVAVVTLLSWVLSREPKFPPLDRLTVLLFLWMLWLSVTSLFSSGPQEQVFAFWLLAEKMLLMTVVAYALTNTRERVELLVMVCALSIGLLGFKTGLRSLLNGGGRVIGPGGLILGNNEFGLALVTMLPLLIYLRRRYSKTVLKWPLQVIIPLNVIATLFTYSRGALLAFCAMSAMAWFRSRHKLISATAVVMVAAGVVLFAPPRWMERMDSIENYQKDGSAQVRLYMWRLASAVALKHPVLGGGYHWNRNVGEVNRDFAGKGFHWPLVDRRVDFNNDQPPMLGPRSTHSVWFGVLGEQGFPGFFLFLAFGLFMLFDARWLMRHTRRRPDLDWANYLGRMLQASLVGYAVAGAFATMYYYDAFYVLVVITAAARRVVAAELATAPRPLARAAVFPALQSGSPLRPHPMG